jgi:hypothetical protein
MDLSILVRMGIVLSGFLLWHLSQKFIANSFKEEDLLVDRVHIWTKDWNLFIHSHLNVARAVLIASSVMIDLVTLWVIWISLTGPSFVPFFGLMILFAYRQLSQVLCGLPKPDGMYWKHPGVPSLFVTYHVGNDFFFSGHTALALYGAIQLYAHHGPWIVPLAAFFVVFEVMTVLVLRAHWTMDVLCAFPVVLAVVWGLQTIS